MPKQIIDPPELPFKSDWELFSVKLHSQPLCGSGISDSVEAPTFATDRHRHYDKCARNQMMLKSMLWGANAFDVMQMTKRTH